MQLIANNRVTGVVSMLAALAAAFAAGGCAMDTAEDGALSVEGETTASAEQPMGYWSDVSRRDLRGLGWDFNDLDRVNWWDAGRAAYDVCSRRGYRGGYFDGRQWGDRFGLSCLDRGADWFDIDRRDIRDGYGFDRLDRVGWGRASRAANSLCSGRGYRGGFFSGHQWGDRFGLMCMNRDLDWYDADRRDIYDSGWGFDNWDNVGWAHAGRAAYDVCSRRGYHGGLFDGGLRQDRYGLMCLY